MHSKQTPMHARAASFTKAPVYEHAVKLMAGFAES